MRLTFSRFAVLPLVLSACFASAQNSPATTGINDPHHTPEWALIAPHLPDPVTATAPQLELAGDVLRARRFPQDALTFYKAALINNGDQSVLLKKLGVIFLETQQPALARASFQRATKVNKSDAEAWNNLGAADFTLGNTRSAVGEYRKAVKLKKTSAIFHSNLALAYFDLKDTQNARTELARAMKLDPDLLQHSGTTGYNLQILASTHYADVCFEMARVYAAQGDVESTLVWLTKASERGLDVRTAMSNDNLLQPYLRDPRVKLMLGNSDQLHSRNVAMKSKPPSLGDAVEK